MKYNLPHPSLKVTLTFEWNCCVFVLEPISPFLVCVCVCFSKKKIYIYIYICKDWNLRPKPTKNSESRPSKPKTIYLLKSRSYKQTTKSCKLRLIELDTQIQQNIFLRAIRGQCVLILIKLFYSQSVFSLSSFFLNLAWLFLWRQFPYIVPLNTSQPSTYSIFRKSFGCLSHQCFSEDNRKAMSWENTVQVLFLHKYGQFNWYSAFPNISSFRCWYDSATSPGAHPSRVIDFLKCSWGAFTPREPRLPRRTPLSSSAFQIMYAYIF